MGALNWLICIGKIHFGVSPLLSLGIGWPRVSKALRFFKASEIQKNKKA